MLHESDDGTSGVKPDLSQDRVRTRKDLVRDFGIPAPTFHIPKGAAFLPGCFTSRQHNEGKIREPDSSYDDITQHVAVLLLGALEVGDNALGDGIESGEDVAT